MFTERSLMGVKATKNRSLNSLADAGIASRTLHADKPRAQLYSSELNLIVKRNSYMIQSCAQGRCLRMISSMTVFVRIYSYVDNRCENGGFIWSLIRGG